MNKYKNLDKLLQEEPEIYINLIDVEVMNVLKEADDSFQYPETANDICLYNDGPLSNPKKCSGCAFGQALQKLIEESIPEDGSISDLIPLAPKYWQEIQMAQDKGVFWTSLYECYYLRKVDLFGRLLNLPGN